MLIKTKVCISMDDLPIVNHKLFSALGGGLGSQHNGRKVCWLRCIRMCGYHAASQGSLALKLYVPTAPQPPHQGMIDELLDCTHCIPHHAAVIATESTSILIRELLKASGGAQVESEPASTNHPSNHPQTTGGSRAPQPVPQPQAQALMAGAALDRFCC